MKQLFSTLLVIICSSCTIKNDEVESIEIMAYYYNLNIDQSKLMLDCLFYSRTNNDGFTEVLSQKLPSSSRKDFGYEYSINKQLINEIEIQTKTSNEKSFDAKLNKTITKLYCGPTIRYRIKYKSGKSFLFVTNENIMEKDKKFQVFEAFYKTVTQNTKPKMFNSVRREYIKSKQAEFEKFTIRRDSLHHSFPPLPKKSEIKFIKL